VIRLYIDEDAMDQDLVRALRVRGMDVITVLDANMTERKSHAGIILARQQQYSIGEQMQRILRISAERTSAAMKNRIEFLSAW